MIEPLLERIGELEKSNRRWKATSLILGTILLATMTTGTLFFGLYGYHARQQAMQAREEEALMQAERARAVAEEAARAQQKAPKE